MKGRVDSKEEKEGEQTQITPRHIKIRFVVRPLRMGWQLARSNKHLLMSSYNVTLKVASPSFSVLAIIRILSSEGGERRSDQRARCSRPFFKGKLVPHEIDPLLRVRPTSRSPPSCSSVALALPPRSLGAALACLRDGLSFAGATGSRLFRHAPAALEYAQPRLGFAAPLSFRL